MSEAFRIEHDIIGEMHIPQDVYYGIHSVRAAENFPITGQRLQKDMINIQKTILCSSIYLGYYLFVCPHCDKETIVPH